MGNSLHKLQNSSRRDGPPGPGSDNTTTLIFNLCGALYNAAKMYSPKLKDFTNLYGIIDQINEMQQNPFSVTEPSRQAAIRPFLKWCKQHGVKHKGVQIAEAPGAGFGIMATDHIAANEAVIAVPNETMMNSNEAFSEFEALVDAARIDHSWLQVPLALKLINERLGRSGSRWRPYVDVLPKQTPHPIFFSPYEFGLIQGSPCYIDGMNLVYEICCQYARLYRELFNFTSKGVGIGNLRPSNFTFEAYRWGVTIALSRSLKISNEQESSATVLVPFWDLCNNGEEALYTRVNVHVEGEPDTLYLCAYAMRDLKDSEELHICYRESSTPIEYFTIWGLALVPYFTSIKVKVSAIDRNYSVKSNYLQKLQKRSCPIELQIYDNPVPLNYQDLQALFIISATSEDLRTGTVSVATWRRAWNHMIKRLRKRLGCYSNQSADLVPGASSNSPQTFLATSLVATEKRVLTAALSQCTILLDYTAHDIGYTEFLIPLGELPAEPSQDDHQSVESEIPASMVDVDGRDGCLAIPVQA